MRNKLLAAGLIIFSLLLIGDGAQAQIIYGQPAAANIQTIFTGWSLEDSIGKGEINQFLIPITGFIPLGENFEASFYAASLSSTLSLPSSTYGLSGMSDIRAQANRSFMDDMYLLSAGINFPTGKKKLDIDEEWSIIEYLSKDYLGFPISRLGEGFGFNLLAGAARMLGEFKCGGSLMYQFNGSYTPYKDAPNYNPGDYFNLNGGVEWRKNSTQFNADIIGTFYTPDRTDGRKSFRQSPQFDFRLSGLYDMKTLDLSGALRYLVRGRNARYDAAENVLERLKVYGNEFDLSGRATIAINDWTLTPTAQMKLISKNEYDFGQSKIFSIGAALDKKIDKHAVFGFGFEYMTGTADDSKIDLSGIRMTSRLSAGF
jgi:hypothetical protein